MASFIGTDLVAMMGHVTVLVVIAAAIFFLFFRKRLYNHIRQVHYIRRLPGRKGYHVIGHVMEMNIELEDLMKTIISFCIPGHSLSQMHILHRVYAILYKSKSVEAILSSSVHIDKAYDYIFARPWLGTGLITSEGEKWFKRRRLLTPTFHLKILEGFMNAFNEHSQVLVGNLGKEVEKIVDILNYSVLCTLDIICETAMGKKINVQNDAHSEYVKALKVISGIIHIRIFSPWIHPDWLFQLTSKGKIHHKCLKVIHDFTNKIIKERKAEYDNNNIPSNKTSEVSSEGVKKRLAFLDLLLIAEAEDRKLDDEGLREEVTTFMFAGHDTTAVAISWCILLLGWNPKHQEKVYEELLEIFGDSDRPVEMADLSRMKYLDLCIKESLRLYPSVPVITRVLKEDVTIDGHKVAAGTTSMIVPFMVHRDPDVFPNPEEFDPERFLPERSKDRSPYAFIPFSAGPRNCIGQKFAQMEEKVVLANILRNFKVESVQKREDVVLMAELILRPKEGALVKLTPRKK